MSLSLFLQQGVSAVKIWLNYSDSIRLSSCCAAISLDTPDISQLNLQIRLHPETLDSSNFVPVRIQIDSPKKK